jgi:hypothetical protein
MQSKCKLSGIELIFGVKGLKAQQICVIERIENGKVKDTALSRQETLMRQRQKVTPMLHYLQVNRS